MSFSSEVKTELAKHLGKSRHCQIAELAAIMHFSGQYGRSAEGDFMIGFQTENEAVVRKGFTLLQKTFNIETDVSNSRIDCFRKGNLYCISIIDQVLVKEILDLSLIHISEPTRH